jgi:hypothetical protein
MEIYKPGRVPAATFEAAFGKVQVNFVNYVYKPGTARAQDADIDVRKRDIALFSRKVKNAVLEDVRQRKATRDRGRVSASVLPAAFAAVSEYIGRGTRDPATLTYVSVADEAKLAGRHDEKRARTVRRPEEAPASYKLKKSKRQHDGILAWIDPEAQQRFETDPDAVRTRARSMLVVGKAANGMPFMMHVFYNATIRVSLGAGTTASLADIAGPFRKKADETATRLVDWILTLAGKERDASVPIRAVAVSTQGQLKSPYWFGAVSARSDPETWKKRFGLASALRKKLATTMYGAAAVGRIETLALPHMQSDAEKQKLRTRLMEDYEYDDKNLPYDVSKLRGVDAEKISMTAEFDRRERRRKELIKALMNAEKNAYQYLKQRAQESSRNITFDHLKTTSNAVETLESGLLRTIDRWRFDFRLLALPTRVFDFARYSFSKEGFLVLTDASFKPEAPDEFVKDVQMSVFAETDRTEAPATNLDAMFALAQRLRQPKRLVFQKIEMAFNDQGGVIMRFHGDDREHVERIDKNAKNTGLSVQDLLDVEATVPFWWTTGTFLVTSGGKDPWRSVSICWEILSLLFTRSGPAPLGSILDLGKSAEWTQRNATDPGPKRRAGRTGGTTCKPPHRVPASDGACSSHPETGEERYAKPTAQGDLCCFVKPKKLSKEATVKAYQEQKLPIPKAVLELLGMNAQPVEEAGEAAGLPPLSFDEEGRVKVGKRLATRVPVGKLEAIARAYGVPTAYGKTPLSRQQIATLMSRKMVAEAGGLPASKNAKFYAGLYEQLALPPGEQNFGKAWSNARNATKSPFVRS